MNKSFKLTVYSLVFSLFAMSMPLSAGERIPPSDGIPCVGVECNNDIETRAVAGERALSEIESVKLEKKRAAAYLQAMLEEIDDEPSHDEDALVSADLTPRMFTTHLGAVHRPIRVSPFGDEVTLEDGSVWEVKHTDRHKTLDWYTSDMINILLNDAFFAGQYVFAFHNEVTGSFVRVKLVVPPVYNGIYTHWIFGMDRLNREICLEDGSIWKFSSWDLDIYDKWMLNDTIIIGCNNSVFGWRPNILINAFTNTYIPATREY